MKYLLDTHTLLWIIDENARLSEKSRSIFLDMTNDIYLSSASLWELSIKVSLNKIEINNTFENFIQDHVLGNDIKIMKIELPHIIRVSKIPFHHRDPFDRMIIAQSIEDNIPVISGDKIFDRYLSNRIW